LPGSDKPSIVQSTYTEPLARASAYPVPLRDGHQRATLGVLSSSRVQTARSLAQARLTIDVAMLVAGAALTLAVAGPIAGTVGWWIVLATSVLLVFAARGAYDTRLGLRAIDELAGVLIGMSAVAMAAISARTLLGGGHDAATSLGRYALLSGLLVAGGRVALLEAERAARRRGDVAEPTLIVGAGRVGHLTAKRLARNPDIGLRPVGFLDANPLGSPDDDGPTLPVLGASWDLDRVVKEHEVRHVVIAFSTAPHHVLLRIVRRSRELGLAVSVLPRLFEIESARPAVERLGALPLIDVRSADPKGWQFRAKYAIERGIAAVALVLSAPLFALAAIGIWLTMGRPVLFRQPRVGTDGHQFCMLKLRTMRGDPDEYGEADIDWALEQLGRGEVAVMERDSEDRRTALGRFLRRFSLDELPQLWNVLRGDMSLVGPRPERVSYVERFASSVPRYAERHRVRSGITGWAQVNGLRGKTSLDDRVEWDNYYIENWSPWLDLKILFMTVACVLRGRHEEDST
jgi:exopolysaccharide biosynthesis polyprenyl glycosylphosphotransferase